MNETNQSHGLVQTEARSADITPTEAHREQARTILDFLAFDDPDEDIASLAGLLAGLEDGWRRSIGGNSPPEPIAEAPSPGPAWPDPERLIDPGIIHDLLAAEFAPLAARGAELTEAAEDWKADLGTTTITTQAGADLTADLMQQLAGYAKTQDGGEVEDVRKRIKRPVYEAGLAIDAFFGALRDRIREIVGMNTKADQAPSGTMQHALNMWVRQEAARRQAEARAEADRLAKEAADAAAVAVQAGGEDRAVIAAVVAEDAAAEAARAAAVPARDMVRSQTARGTTVGLRANWIYEVVDFMALVRAIAEGKAPLDFVIPNDRVIKAAISGPNGRRECPGLAIRNDAIAARRGA